MEKTNKETIASIRDISTKSVLEGPEKRLQELINGDEPKNDEEKVMVAQINQIISNGHMIINPSM